MAYRNKTYVCFDGDTDIHYYRLMCAWKQHDGIAFDFYNAHDLNRSWDTSLEESIKAQLRDRLNNTKVFVVLVGEKTRYLQKFARWEMLQALRLDLPIVAVNLNGLRQQDPERCPPTIRDALAVHISFNASIMERALSDWPTHHGRLKAEGRVNAFYYPPDAYRSLGL